MKQSISRLEDMGSLGFMGSWKAKAYKGWNVFAEFKAFSNSAETFQNVNVYTKLIRILVR